MRNPEQYFLASAASSLAALEKRAKQLKATATALSWGLLGSTLGYAFGSLWIRLDPHAFLSIREVSSLAYFTFLGCYLIAARSHFATNRCLRNAKLLFIAEEVTGKEYNRMRDKCLKKGELI